jgi:hydroxymethylpyrimidine pyrophosphatase-like HAD family hydrolase
MIQEQEHRAELNAVDDHASPTPTIEVACPTADEVSVTYDSGVDRSAISDYAELVLREICSRACIRSVIVSSGARTPESQARAMYQNAQSNLARERRLYGRNGNQVLDQYEQGVAQGQDATTVQHNMAEAIRQSPDSFHHVSRAANLSVFDVGPKSVGSEEAGQRLAQEARADARVIRFFQPPNDAGYHFEIQDP